MAAPWLLLSLSLPWALAAPAGWRARGDPAVALVALEALVASGEGHLSRGALGALVASAAGRAQGPRAPCGECPSVPTVLALAGKAPGGPAGLEATELSWLGAAVVATLRDPPGACGNIDGDTDRDINGDTDGDNGDINEDTNGIINGDNWDTNGDIDGDSNGDTDRDNRDVNGDTHGDINGDAYGDINGDTNGDTDGDTGRDIHEDIDGDTDGDSNGDTPGDIHGDPDGDTDEDTNGDTHGDTEATAGSWASRVRALHRQFATDVTGNVTADVAVHGGPGLREVAELLAAIEPNYCGDSGHQACVDARGVLAATSAVSPRVGTGRVLVALGVLVLRGHRLCPGAIGDSDDTDSHRGDINTWHHGDTDDIDTPQADTEGHRGDIEGHHSPTASSPWSGDNVTVPTATNGTGTAEQLSATQRYVLGTLMGLALALVPLVALALVRCPRCPGFSRCPRCPQCPRCPRCTPCRGCRGCRGCPQPWGRPLLDGLAAGALSGDALLHVLPQALGIHSHSGGSQAEQGGGPHGPPWQLLAVLGGLYGGFVMERLLGGLGAPPEEVKDGEPDPDPAQSAQEPPTPGAGRAQALLLSAGGAVHRLADGLALGSAFAASESAGAAAGAGLVLHELPRAFGDALLLSQSGLSPRRMVALAAAGALPVVPGVVAGLALGAAPAARSWLGALGGGFLLHLALCHMVPAMLSVRSGSRWALLALQSAGLIGGWGLLLLLALGEEGGAH